MARLIGHRTRRDPFVRIERTVMEDAGLSFKAKALYGYLLDKGEVPGWATDVERICTVTADGAYAIRAALVELEAAGYLVRTDAGAGGRGRRAEWHIYDEAKPAENREVSQPRLIAETATDARGNRDATPTHRESNKKTEKEGARARSARKSGAAPKPNEPRTIEDARALLIADEVWRRADPKPALGFPQVRLVARKLAAVRGDDHSIIEAMLAAPTITVAAVEIVLNGRGPRRNGSRQEPTAEDWAATEREALAREATTTKGKR